MFHRSNSDTVAFLLEYVLDDAVAADCTLPAERLVSISADSYVCRTVKGLCDTWVAALELFVILHCLKLRLCVACLVGSLVYHNRIW